MRCMGKWVFPFGRIGQSSDLMREPLRVRPKLRMLYMPPRGRTTRIPLGRTTVAIIMGISRWALCRRTWLQPQRWPLQKRAYQNYYGHHR